MNGLLAYPRLSSANALSVLNQIKEVAGRDPRELASLSSVSHPRAEPVPTGATVATAEHISQVRETVCAALEGWLIGHPVPRGKAIAFDLELGRSLHESLRILPADAAHDETWSFLSAVVFPDVVWTRFPDLHPNRLLGTRNRNTLRRAWFRYDVIGDLQRGAVNPLGEDEMTGIFERSQLARDRHLVRTVAQIILESDVTNRSELVRNLMKGVTALTGTYLLDGLTREELIERVEGLTQTPQLRKGDRLLDAESEPRAAVAVLQPETPTVRRIERVTGHDRTDLVRRFHAETLNLCKEVEKVLGRPPSALLSMIGQMGGVDAARTVVGASTPSDTFSLLWGSARLDLSLEALILRDEFQGLFEDALRKQAANRLELAEY